MFQEAGSFEDLNRGVSYKNKNKPKPKAKNDSTKKPMSCYKQKKETYKRSLPKAKIYIKF
ncbi:MAG: hypothetical protein CL674_13825 [Bdellovibrionaceae bacterium]|nr:hypothetical protein [Pseudobdellovibrionaceae bacterium]